MPHACSHYDALGVGPDEGAAGVRHAYRDLERQSERAHTGLTPWVRTILRAHAVLSERRRRAAYDQLRGQPSTTRDRETTVDLELCLRRDFHGSRPGLDEVCERLAANFTPNALPKSGRRQRLDLAVRLAPRERARTLTLQVPTFHPCPACHGAGRSGAFPCGHCDASGYVEEPAAVTVHLPADAPRRTVALSDLGIQNLYLQLQIVA